jgi:hypothetical protein
VEEETTFQYSSKSIIISRRVEWLNATKQRRKIILKRKRNLWKYEEKKVLIHFHSREAKTSDFETEGTTKTPAGANHMWERQRELHNHSRRRANSLCVSSLTVFLDSPTRISCCHDTVLEKRRPYVAPTENEQSDKHKAAASGEK